MQTHLGINSPAPVIKILSPSWYQEGIFLLEVRVFQRMCSFKIFIDIAKLPSIEDAPIYTPTGNTCTWPFPKLWSTVGYQIFGTLIDDQKMVFWYNFNLQWMRWATSHMFKSHLYSFQWAVLILCHFLLDYSSLSIYKDFSYINEIGPLHCKRFFFFCQFVVCLFVCFVVWGGGGHGALPRRHMMEYCTLK